MSELSTVRRQSSPVTDEANAPRRRVLRSGLFGVVDVGSTKIACLIGRGESDGTLRVTGFGWQRSRGVRNGAVADLDDAVQAIRAAVGQAEEMADTRLRAVTLNLSCGGPESRLFNVQWPVGGRAVDESDLRRIVGEGRARAASEGRETIHNIPLSFSADDTSRVLDPRGLHCDTLSARLHVVDASMTALRNLGICISKCDLDIAELVSAPLAAGLSALVEDERELGAVVVDMGGGTTSLAVFSEGQFLHTAQIPVGGMHVTNDLARVLSTTVAHAERMKTLYGGVQESPEDAREMLPVPLVGEEEHHIAKVPRTMVVNVIRPRLEETFELVKDRLESSGMSRANARVVLTGGGSQLVGVRDMAARILDRQVRLGRPFGLRGIPDSASGPAFAVAAGLLQWAAGEGRVLQDLDLMAEHRPGAWRRVVNWLKERV